MEDQLTLYFAAAGDSDHYHGPYPTQAAAYADLQPVEYVRVIAVTTADPNTTLKVRELDVNTPIYTAKDVKDVEAVMYLRELQTANPDINVTLTDQGQARQERGKTLIAAGAHLVEANPQKPGLYNSPVIADLRTAAALDLGRLTPHPRHVALLYQPEKK